MGNAPRTAADAGQHPLWFSPPGSADSRRRALTRDRVVAEALTVIGTDGAAALSMRALAARLGVVPAALYRHVRSKEQRRSGTRGTTFPGAVPKPIDAFPADGPQPRSPGDTITLR
jgi:Bacterial regulatory proteins, tetR family